MIGGKAGMLMALVVAVGMNFFSYWFSDKMVLRMYNAQEVDATTAPRFYNMVRDLAQRAELPMPRVYLINEQAPNAFATGRNPQHAAVAATTGILNALSERELLAARDTLRDLADGRAQHPPAIGHPPVDAIGIQPRDRQPPVVGHREHFARCQRGAIPHLHAHSAGGRGPALHATWGGAEASHRVDLARGSRDPQHANRVCGTVGVDAEGRGRGPSRPDMAAMIGRDREATRRDHRWRIRRQRHAWTVTHKDEPAPGGSSHQG